MKKLLIFILAVFLLSSFAYAAPKSAEYNGRTYYAVNSADASEDSGNEVCAKLGKTCAGYTAYSTEVCKKLHPDAAVTSGVDGSKAGFYCNGAPQGGVCGRMSNTCNICPACNVNVECSEQIGGLFREMYVECSGSEKASESCDFKIQSKSTASLFGELSSLNSIAQKCPVPIGQASKLVGSNSVLQVMIAMKDGSSKSFYAVIKDKKLAELKASHDGTVNYIVETDEASLDSLLSADNKFGTFSTLYANKKIKLRAVSFFGKFKMLFAKPIFGFIAKKSKVDIVEIKQEEIGLYPDKYVCEFYQKNKKLVTCAAYKAADTFCTQAFGSAYAKSEKCEESGIIICSNPCEAPVKQIMPKSCAFDNDRPRGNQAPPISFCREKPKQEAKAKGTAPKGCADTYLPGHDMYASNKQLWDGFSADSSAVCQSNQPVSGCLHSVQTGQRGSSIPYYLCWY